MSLQFFTEYNFEDHCNGTLDIGDSGDLFYSGTKYFSFAFPANYGSNLNCTVTLTTTPGRKILITWEKFNVEQRNDLSCADTLTIYDGNMTTGTPLNSDKCGNFTSSLLNDRYPTQTSSGNSITFRLQTDGTGDNDFFFVFTSYTDSGKAI